MVKVCTYKFQVVSCLSSCLNLTFFNISLFFNSFIFVIVIMPFFVSDEFSELFSMNAPLISVLEFFSEVNFCTQS